MAEEARRLCEGAAVLAVWRGKRGLAQAALARRAGLSASYVAEIETGAKRGSVDALVKLAAALRRWRGGEAVAEGSAGGPQTLALFRKPNRSPSNPLILWWAQ